MGKTPLDASQEHYIQVNCYFKHFIIYDMHMRSALSKDFAAGDRFWYFVLTTSCLVFQTARSSFSDSSYIQICKFQQSRFSVSHWRHKLCNGFSSRMGFLPSPYQPGSFQAFLYDSNRES